MEIITLLEKIEDIVEDASRIPMSGKVVIDKEEVLEIIKEIRIKLPDEIKQASWIKEERQRILSESKNEASGILTEAKMKQESLIEEHSLTQIANEKAREIIDNATKSSNEIKSGTIDYCDDLLKKIQMNLESIIATLDENRNEFKEL